MSEPIRNYISRAGNEELAAIVGRVSRELSKEGELQHELTEARKRITDLERVLNDCRQDYLYLLSIKSVRSKRIQQIEEVLNIK
jgi:hypothetical protein